MTRLNAIVATCAVAALIGAGGATAQPSSAAPAGPGSQCFSTTQIQHWKVANPRQINVRVNAGGVFQINLADDCNSLMWSDNTPVIEPAAGVGRICSATDLSTIKVLNHATVEHCIVSSVTRLTPGEIAALTRKATP